MKFFGNAPDNWYEEIKSYFPKWYADIAEMDALWRVWGVFLDKLQNDIQNVLDNYFITSCDEDTIAFWEDFIGVHMASSVSIEQRRRILMTLFSGFGKCSRSKIQQLLRKFTGTEADVELIRIDDEGNSALKVRIDIQNSENWNPVDVDMVLDRVAPAHLTREAHYWIEAGGTLSIFYGTAIYTFETTTFKMSPFDIESVDDNYYIDELGNMLLDETGLVLFD